MLLNFFPQILHTIDLATSPSWRAGGSTLASVSAEGAGPLRSFMSFPSLSPSQSIACVTLDIVLAFDYVIETMETIQLPVFFRANSALSLSNPIRTSCSKSVAIM